MKAFSQLKIYAANTSCNVPLHSVITGINAGFPSPADDFLDASIDLNKEFIKNPSSTFYARVRGTSMIEAGLSDGDLLIIDKSLEPRSGKIAVCYVDGEFTIKRIRIEKNVVILLPANNNFNPITVTPENDFIVWGIVTNVIKSV